jgi:uncharacterized phage protein (TIGR02218 family)
MALLRACSGSLALALAGGVQLWSADLFQFTLIDGVTTYYWTSWPQDLVVGSTTYSSRLPWLKRGQWSVENNMSIPTMDVTLLALNDGFAGGANIKLQTHNGLFDGASFLLSRAYMTTPGATASLGSIDLFGGIVGGIDLDGGKALINTKGKNNMLDQQTPRNVYQLGCLRSFCDVNCTLSRASFTTAMTVGVAPTRIFLPWSGAAPGNASLYKYGTVTFTTGQNSGQTRNVEIADGSGLTLAYPLYYTPLAGDAFTAFEGCDKTQARCVSLSNEDNRRSYDFVPPPDAAY